jgi:hypothetical protein
MVVREAPIIARCHHERLKTQPIFSRHFSPIVALLQLPFCPGHKETGDEHEQNALGGRRNFSMGAAGPPGRPIFRQPCRRIKRRLSRRLYVRAGLNYRF